VPGFNIAIAGPAASNIAASANSCRILYLQVVAFVVQSRIELVSWSRKARAKKQFFFEKKNQKTFALADV
jgi:hypothetical protein